MSVKYKKERDLLFEKLYEKRGCILYANELLEVMKMMKISGEDLIDLFDVLSKRGLVTIEDSAETQVNDKQVTTIVVTIKSMTLTPKGLDYWEETLEK
jgi:hypothetical protein